jgi:hypothetical protein
VTYAPTSPFRRKRPAGHGDGRTVIEIFAPDRDATDLLLLYAAPLFPAKIAPGAVWIVRLQVPGGGGSMLELLSLVQRWLKGARLPWANVRYDGRSYLIRPSTEFAQFAAAATANHDTPGGRERATAWENVQSSDREADDLLHRHVSRLGAGAIRTIRRRAARPGRGPVRESS